MAADKMNLTDKLILVTGAGTGIGLGVANLVADMGANVVLHYRGSADGALESVERIQAQGRRAKAVQGDLSVVADCRRVVDEAAEFLGGLDGLVNNAGVTTTIDFLEVTEEQFDRLYQLNIRGQFFCAQQAVRHMVARGQALRA
ncbi:MAG: SDR family NAD(P)-dependent oxidoreductase, partial [Caldilineaceae bacterium]